VFTYPQKNLDFVSLTLEAAMHAAAFIAAERRLSIF
jgi:hypothetical protein